jgi:RNA polymerase sigma-70 factor (ECF subfamily)
MVVAPSPVAELHRAVAVAEVSGPAAGLALVDELDLARSHLFHAVRADLLRRLGRSAEAAEAYGTALSLTQNEPERAFLQRRRDALPG